MNLAIASKPQRKMISILVPVYNESETVEHFHQVLSQELQKITYKYDYEILFSDNHSSDSTYEKLKAIAKKDPAVRVLRLSKNFGYQRSIFTAYLNALGDAAIQIDCDFQDPPELIVKFIESWEAGYEVVYGVRQTRKESNWIHWSRKTFYKVIRWLSQDNLPVNAGDFRLVDRKVLGVLEKITDNTPYLRGAIAAMGFRQLGIAYDRNERRAGKSKFGLRSLFALAFDGIFNHSTVPLRLASYFGLFMALTTMLLICAYVIGKLFYQGEWPAGFTTLAVFSLGSMAVNGIFFGIMGEYLGRIYKQVKKQPISIVEERVGNPRRPVVTCDVILP